MVFLEFEPYRYTIPSNQMLPRYAISEGEDIVKNVEKQGSNSGSPKKTVTIKDSGELK